MRCAPESLSGGGAAPAAGVSVALPSRRPQPRGQSAPTWTGLLLALLVLLATTLSLTQAGDCPLPASSTTLLKWDLQVEGQQNIKIDVVPEALQALEAIDGDLAVVSVMGPYRTGKSFLLNRLLPSKDARERKPFQIGDAVHPETEEVAMYIFPPCADPALEGRSLVFLDSPGLFAPNRASVFDSQLLAVLNLVSSVVIYNNMGVIDRSAIEKLSLAIETAFSISYFSDRKNDEQISRPHLIWALQNFHLRLEDKDGNTMSTDAWIQAMLKDIDTSNAEKTTYVDQFNRFFQSLDAWPLPHPAKTFSEAAQLSKMSEEELNPQYLEAINGFRKRIFETMGAKEIGPRKMDGSSLASLLAVWTADMNVPLGKDRMASAADLLMHVNAKEMEKIMAHYQEEMDKFGLPVDEEVLERYQASVLDAVTHELKTKGLEQFVQAVRTSASSRFAVYQTRNRDMLSKIHEARLRVYTENMEHLVLPMSDSDLEKAHDERLQAALREMAGQSLSEPGHYRCGASATCAAGDGECCGADGRCGSGADLCSCEGCHNFVAFFGRAALEGTDAQTKKAAGEKFITYKNKNQELKSDMLGAYTKAMDALDKPMDEEKLRRLHEATARAATWRVRSSAALQAQLQESMESKLGRYLEANRQLLDRLRDSRNQAFSTEIDKLDLPLAPTELDKALEAATTKALSAWGSVPKPAPRSHLCGAQTCEPNHCCGANGECGEGNDFCACNGCLDFSNTVGDEAVADATNELRKALAARRSELADKNAKAKAALLSQFERKMDAELPQFPYDTGKLKQRAADISAQLPGSSPAKLALIQPDIIHRMDTKYYPANTKATDRFVDSANEEHKHTMDQAHRTNEDVSQNYHQTAMTNIRALLPKPDMAPELLASVELDLEKRLHAVQVTNSEIFEEEKRAALVQQLEICGGAFLFILVICYMRTRRRRF